MAYYKQFERTKYLKFFVIKHVYEILSDIYFHFDVIVFNSFLSCLLGSTPFLILFFFFVSVLPFSVSLHQLVFCQSLTHDAYSQQEDDWSSSVSASLQVVSSSLAVSAVFYITFHWDLPPPSPAGLNPVSHLCFEKIEKRSKMLMLLIFSNILFIYLFFRGRV